MFYNSILQFIGLSICPDNKRFINENYGMELLIKFLQNEGMQNEDRIAGFATTTMRNLSDSATHIQNPDRLAQALLSALRSRPQVIFQPCCNDLRFFQITFLT